MHAILALEDGRIFRGKAYGARTTRGGEVVFNTSITGYQEVFTDPSYAGQLVCLTYPHIGNVGTNLLDQEAPRPYIEALIVREFSQVASNWRSQQAAEEYLATHHIPVISHVDTRALVRHLRTHGAMRGVLSTVESDAERLVARARALPPMVGLDLARTVTCAGSYEWTEPSVALSETTKHRGEGTRFHVVVYDYGIKQNILRRVVDVGCRVTVVPALTAPEDALALKPDGVFLSNGPGDP